MKVFRSTSAGILLSGLVCSAASAAPQAALNKSVTITFTVSAQITNGGPQTSGTRSVVRTLYISSAGRIFARSNRREGRDSEVKELAPNETAGTYRFAGDRLIGVMKFGSGAGQLTVSFEGGGQSCTASVQGGREGGRAYQWRAVNGEIRQGSLTFSGATCSIREGNAFAG